MAKKLSLIIVVVLYTISMTFMCYVLPFSQLYRLMHKYESLFKEVESAAAAHIHEANEYFKGLHPQESDILYKDRIQKEEVLFAIGVVTVRRLPKDWSYTGSTNYLVNTLALVDQVLKDSTYLQTSVPFICNVEYNPLDHTDALSLYPFFPYTERYGNNSLGAPMLTFPNSDMRYKDWKHHETKYNKETLDYSFCLRTALYLKPKYVILLEDDTIPHRHFPVILQHLIESRLKLHPNYAYLKLYFPPKWQGFALEFSRVFDLLMWSGILSSLGYLILLLTSKCNYPPSDNVITVDLSEQCLSLPFRIRIPFNKKAFLIVFVLSMFSCWLVGRQNVVQFRRLSSYSYRLQRAEECCTQAQLYPVDIVDSLSQYLSKVGVNKHTDLAISDFAAEEGLPTWQVEPNLFLHWGLHTSLNSKQKHPEEFVFNI